MFRKLLLIIIAVSFIACASDSSKKPFNNTITESGATAWMSSYTPGNVQIDKSFKFVGSEDKSDPKAFRKYYVWKKDDNHFIYIVDFKVRGTWSFPINNDGLLGKGGNTSDPDLLAYQPFKYSLWKKMAANSEAMVQDLGVTIPECYVAFEKVKMSPSRSAAYFVLYVESTDCDYQGWGGIGGRFNDAISM
jgi:hypothetical protein